jgi:beta-glucosidase
MMTAYFLFFLSVCFAATSAKHYRYPSILQSMSIEEKIGQMIQIDINKFIKAGTVTVDYDMLEEWISKYKLASLLNSPFSGGEIDNSYGWTASEWRNLIINIQQISEKVAANNKSNNIPIIYGLDSIHGATYVKGAALFPQALSVAASFNMTLAFELSKVSSRDTRAAGIQWLFAPVLGLGNL